MAEIVQQIFCIPPIAVARLGGSTVPLDAYTWADPPNPRADGETVVVPAWSLDILPNGAVEPVLPTSIAFRDNDLIRPVCPFVEVHARLGEPGSAPATWREAPVTPALLASFGANASALRLVVTAQNRKSARRRQDLDLVFGTFPPVEIAGDLHTPVPLNGSSPSGVAQPMIPAGRHISLGSVQVMQSRPPPAPGSVNWPSMIDVSVLRFRFTPAKGQFYGPPQAAQPTPESPVPAVTAANAFLNANAGWFNQPGDGGGFIEPADTYDERGSGNPGQTPSLGVVDDTCEARVDLTLTLPGGGAPLTAHATIFVAPPDFAPDRRPFLSLADELNDRGADAAARNGQLSPSELDEWVEDLFERIYETVSLVNVDFWRDQRGITLTGNRLAATAIPGDNVTPPELAMGSRDALRNRDLTVGPRTADVPLPLSEHARSRHRSISDIDSLRDLIGRTPSRLKDLVRGPFEIEPGETANRTTMRMPPFMRQSNALPLTLAAWQYDLLMHWVALVVNPPPAPAPAMVAAAPPATLSSEAAARRAAGTRQPRVALTMPPIVPAPAGAPGFRQFQSRVGAHVLIVPFSRIYDLDEAADDASISPLLAAALGDPMPGEAPLDRIDEPPPQSISLNVSSSCNLSCGYCYASRGAFNGAQPEPMSLQTARAAIDTVLASATRTAPVTIGFLGGEPFANRALIHAAVGYAAAEGERLGHDVRFSVTTNGTLLRHDDLDLMRRHSFAVTVSLDGASALQDHQRPRAHGGRGSWADVVRRVGPLLASPGLARLAARATVTRDNLDIAGRLEAISGLGFPEVGVSPLRVSADPSQALRDADWGAYFRALVAAADIELTRVCAGQPIRLTNLAIALKQLHRGASSPFPCGAGGGYFSVAADGRWYACHRAIGNASFELGSNDGLDAERRRDFLLARHVHAQTDCGACWARYLCSGACHQEAAARTPASCDFIRDWLDFCLKAYCELSSPRSLKGSSHEWNGITETVAP